MQQIQLSQCQQIWLDHINKTEQLNISMVAYAKQNNISVQVFYCAKSTLLEKGSPIVKKEGTFVNTSYCIKMNTPKNIPCACRVMLCSGVAVEFDDVELDLLFQKLNQL
ncbi:MAG: hypothetical protein KAH18_12720, partial [Psychromonas sp.]|nr:hypothetical protein [Psychromonas sp.]